jgi:hypothetical protein
MADARVMRDAAPAAVLLALVDDVDWAALPHGDGPATAVPALLRAIIGDASRPRAAAWDDLAGAVLRQGAVYPATAPVVPILAGLAAWPGHPSRIEALRFLREIAIATDFRAFPDATGPAAVRATVVRSCEPLLARWCDEDDPIRGTLLLLLSAMPDDLLVRYVALSDDELPADHHEAFAILTSGGPTCQEEFELVCDFIDWAMGI